MPSCIVRTPVKSTFQNNFDFRKQFIRKDVDYSASYKKDAEAKVKPKPIHPQFYNIKTCSSRNNSRENSLESYNPLNEAANSIIKGSSVLNGMTELKASILTKNRVDSVESPINKNRSGSKDSILSQK